MPHRLHGVAPSVSIVYSTARIEPHFDWFADALADQVTGQPNLEVILVDAHFDQERAHAIEQLVAGRFELRHVPPKPTPISGPYRLTTQDYFSAASARNTGLVYARYPYLVFVDDLSVPLPSWWERVALASLEGLVVAGAYQKHWDMEVSHGRLIKSRSLPSGIDPRWDHGSDTKLTRLTGGEVFGASLGAPTALLRKINGFDELCDPVGGEDYQLGIRLEWTGARIHYDRRMLTIESEEGHRSDPSGLRVDKLLDPSEYLIRLEERFGVKERKVLGRSDASHMILDVLYGLGLVNAVGNYYDLTFLTPDNLHEIVKSFPQEHWFDGQPLCEM